MSEPTAARPAQLFWEMMFADGQGIASFTPEPADPPTHLLTVGVEYLFRTGLRAGPPGATAPAGRQIRYRLEAGGNGGFRRAGSTELHVQAESLAIPCVIAAVTTFKVLYQPTRPGPATIRAYLIIDGGAAAERTLNLLAWEPARPDIAPPADANLREFGPGATET